MPYCVNIPTCVYTFLYEVKLVCTHMIKYIENITWLRGNMKFISSVNKIQYLTSERSFINGKRKFSWKVCIYVQSYAVFDWLAKTIFSHVKMYRIFLRVFKYDFSQWPTTLYNTDVYKIK